MFWVSTIDWIGKSDERESKQGQPPTVDTQANDLSIKWWLTVLAAWLHSIFCLAYSYTTDLTWDFSVSYPCHSVCSSSSSGLCHCRFKKLSCSCTLLLLRSRHHWRGKYGRYRHPPCQACQGSSSQMSIGKIWIPCRWLDGTGIGCVWDLCCFCQINRRSPWSNEKHVLKIHFSEVSLLQSHGDLSRCA